MAKNIKINDVTYNAVSSISVPLAVGGGNAVFPDTSDATATAGDIADGKTAYVGGSKVTGTATGGGGGYATGTYTVTEDKQIGTDILNSLKIDTGLSDIKFFAFHKKTLEGGPLDYEIISGIWIYNNGDYYGIRFHKTTSNNSAYYRTNINNQYTGNDFYNEGNGVMSIRGITSLTKIYAGTEYVWFAI